MNFITLMRWLVYILLASIKDLPVCTLRALPQDSLKSISNITGVLISP